MSDATPPTLAPTAVKLPANIKSRLEESYDAIAPRYNDWAVGDSSLRLKNVDKFLPLLIAKNEEVSVLELGCGSGLPVSNYLLSHPNINVTANDLSSVQVGIAKENLSKYAGRVSFVHGDMLGLRFADQSFDAIIGFYSIIHLPLEEQLELFHNVVHWLKPGGYFLANFGAESLPASELDNWLKEEKGWMFWAGFGADKTVEKLREAGLDIVSREVSEDVVDANFLWVLAKKST
jgi:SAM-dependent methyltransferase